MGVLVGFLQLGGFLAFLVTFAWLATRARKRGSGHSLMAPFEDMWDPRSHRTHIEILTTADRRTPAPAPGDPPVG